MKNIDVRSLVKNVSKGETFMNSGIPLGYVSNIPVLKQVNGKYCLVIPYLKYKLTGVVDKTLVFPARYALTVSVPHGKIVGLDDFSYDERFKKVDFTKPIGFFRHDAVKSFTKDEFNKKRDELYKAYSEIVSAKLDGTPVPESAEKTFSKLIRIILEPSLYPIYKAIDEDFYNKYLA